MVVRFQEIIPNTFTTVKINTAIKQTRKTLIESSMEERVITASK